MPYRSATKGRRLSSSWCETTASQLVIAANIGNRHVTTPQSNQRLASRGETRDSLGMGTTRLLFLESAGRTTHLVGWLRLATPCAVQRSANCAYPTPIDLATARRDTSAPWPSRLLRLRRPIHVGPRCDGTLPETERQYRVVSASLLRSRGAKPGRTCLAHVDDCASRQHGAE